MKRMSVKRKRNIKLLAFLLMTVVVAQLFVAGLSAFAVDNPDEEETLDTSALDSDINILPVGLSSGGSFQVSINDIYKKKLVTATEEEKEELKVELGYSSIEQLEEEHKLFDVSYTAEDGSTVEVKDGDQVDDGTVLRVEVTPEKGPRTVMFNEEKQLTDEGEWVTTTFEHTTNEDVEIKMGDAIVTIDDPYIEIVKKAIEENNPATIAALTSMANMSGAASLEDYKLFDVSYKPIELTDEQIELGLSTSDLANMESVEVVDGDLAPIGAELKIVAKPILGGIKVYINGEENMTEMGQYVENIYTHIVADDVLITPTVDVGFSSIVNDGSANGASNSTYSTDIGYTDLGYNHNHSWSGGGGSSSCTVTQWAHGTCAVRNGTASNTAQMKSMMTLLPESLTQTNISGYEAAYKCIGGTTGNAAHSYNSQTASKTDHLWKSWNGFTFNLNGGTLSISNNDLNRYYAGNGRPLTVSNGTLEIVGESYKAYSTLNNTVSTITLDGGAMLKVTSGTVTNANIVFNDGSVTHGRLDFGSGVTISGTAGTIRSNHTDGIKIDGSKISAAFNYITTTSVGNITIQNLNGVASAITSVQAKGAATLHNFTAAGIGPVTATNDYVSITSVTSNAAIGNISAKTGVTMTSVSANAGNIGTIANSTSGNIAMTTVTASGNIGTITDNGTGSISMTSVTATNGTIGDITDNAGGGITMDRVKSTAISIGKITQNGAGNITMTDVTAGTTIGNIYKDGVGNGSIGMTDVTAGTSIGYIRNDASAGNITMLRVSATANNIGDITKNNAGNISMTDVTAGITIGDITKNATGDGNITMSTVTAGTSIGNIVNAAPHHLNDDPAATQPIQASSAHITMTTVKSPLIASASNGQINATGHISMTSVTDLTGAAKTRTGNITSGYNTTISQSHLLVHRGTPNVAASITSANGNISVTGGTPSKVEVHGEVHAPRGTVSTSVAGSEIIMKDTYHSSPITRIRGAHINVGAGTLMDNRGHNIEGTGTITVTGTAYAKNFFAGTKITVTGTVGDRDASNNAVRTEFLDAKYIQITSAGNDAIHVDKIYGNTYVTNTGTPTGNSIVSITGLGYVYIDAPAYEFEKVFGGGDTVANCSNNTTAHSHGTGGHQYTGDVNMVIKSGKFKNVTGTLTQLYPGGNRVDASDINFAFLGGSIADPIQNLYGGSFNANSGNINMWVSNGTFGNFIYGGNDATDTNVTAASTNVRVGQVASATPKTIYGGGHANGAQSDIVGNTIVTTHRGLDAIGTTSHPTGSSFPGYTRPSIAGGAINGANATKFEDIYGGGHAQNTGSATVGGDTTVNVNHKVNINIYGGGHAVVNNATVVGNTNVNFLGDATNAVDVQYIYGGGHVPAGVAHDASVGTNNTALSKVVANGNVKENIYGGGWANGGNSKANAHNTEVILEAAFGLVDHTVYGGGRANAAGTESASVKDTQVTIRGTVTDNVFGGGHAETTGGNALATSKDTIVDIFGIVSKNVYGGGHAKVGKAQVDNTTVTVQSGGLVNFNVYGAGFGDDPTTIATDNADATQNTIVTITGTVNKDVFGGGTGLEAAVNGFVTMNVTGTGAKEIKGNLYGGGDNNPIEGANAANKSVVMTIDGGKINTDTTINGNVYGGGYSNTAVDANLDKGVLMDVKGTTIINGYAYGGGHAVHNGTVPGQATVNHDIDIIIDNTNIKKTLYGGGVSNDALGFGANTDATKTTGNIDIQVLNNSLIEHSLFGGGTSIPQIGGQNALTRNTSDIDGYVTMLVKQSEVKKDLYGGGDHNDIRKDNAGYAVTLIIEDSIMNADTTTARERNVYAGSLNAITNGGTSVHITGTAGSTIHGDFFGGGHTTVLNNHDAATTAMPSPIKGNVNIVTDTNSSIKGEFFGGGTNDDNLWDQAVIEGFVRIFHNAETVGEMFGGGEFNEIQNNAVDQWAVKLIVGPTGTVGDSSLASNLYGGAREEEVHGNVYVETHSHSRVYGNLYGGGNGHRDNPLHPSDIHGYTNVIVRGSVNDTVYGGGINLGQIDQYTVVDVLAGDTGDIIGKSVYGGGASSKAPVMFHDGDTNTPNGVGYSTKVTIDGFVMEDVYGASRQTDILFNTWVKVENALGAGGTPVKGAITNIKGTVFGASHYELGFNADVYGVTLVEIYGGQIDGASPTLYGNNGAIFGGGSAGSKVYNHIAGQTNDITLEHATTVLIKGKGNTVLIGNHVYGGGEKVGGVQSPVDGSTYVDMTYGEIVKDKDIYGGGFDSFVEGYAEVWVGPGIPLTGTDICKVGGSVYGGGIHPDGIVKHRRGTYVTIREHGRVLQNVYGGGAEGAHLTGFNTSGSKPGTIDDFSANVHIKGIVGSNDTTVVEKGNVYGGGRNADVFAALENGTVVTVYHTGEVFENVFGGGWNGDIKGKKGADVIIYGTVGTIGTVGKIDGPPQNFIGSGVVDRGNVYGGGRDGDIEGAEGAKVHVGMESSGAGNSGLVESSVYGGGFGETKKGEVLFDTDVLVDGDSTVQHSVFGGGRSPGAGNGDQGRVHANTNVEVTGKYTLIGMKDLRTSPIGEEYIFDYNRYLTYENEFMFRGEEETGMTRDLDRIQPNNSAINNWMEVGNVYAGGSWAEIGQDMKVNIHDMDQKAFNRISGGNMGIVAANPVRTVDITNLGIGLAGMRGADETEIDDLNNTKYYTDLYVYTAVRFLEDYVTTNQNDSFLTVYYNLKSTDDGFSIHGLHNTHNSVNHVNSGVYHAWRPKEHTDILVENPMKFHDSAMFRMETDYTVNFENGIYTDNPVSPMQGINDQGPRIVLILDVARDINHNILREHHDGSKTRILGLDDTVTMGAPFAYWEILGTNFLTDLQDRGGTGIIGISVYIPPIYVSSLNVENTNHGGLNKPDYGAGYDIVPEMMTDKGSYMPVDNTAVNRANAAIAKNPTHLTDTTATISENALLATAQQTLNRTNAKNEYTVRQNHAGKVTFEALKEVAKAAKLKLGVIEYQADTLSKDGGVEGRMYINTSKLTNQTGIFSTDIHACKEEVARPTKIFKKFFTNDIAVVKLGQAGEFDATVEVAVKVDLSKLNAEKLQIFAYTEKTNQFTPIDEYDYYVDDNGYLHFYTSIGGDIIITDSDLALRK